MFRQGWLPWHGVRATRDPPLNRTDIVRLLNIWYRRYIACIKKGMIKKKYN